MAHSFQLLLHHRKCNRCNKTHYAHCDLHANGKHSIQWHFVFVCLSYLVCLAVDDFSLPQIILTGSKCGWFFCQNQLNTYHFRFNWRSIVFQLQTYFCFLLSALLHVLNEVSKWRHRWVMVVSICFIRSNAVELQSVYSMINRARFVNCLFVWIFFFALSLASFCFSCIFHGVYVSSSFEENKNYQCKMD